MDDSDPVREPEIDAAVRQSHGLALTQLDADARRCLSAIAALGRKAWSRCGIGALDACAPGGDGTCTLCTEQFDGAGAARLVGALEHMCVAHAQRRLAAHVPQPARRRADAIPGPLFVVSPSKLGQYFNLGQCNRLLHQSTERGGGVADMEDLPSDFRQATIDRGETFELNLAERLHHHGLSRRWMAEKLGGGPAAARGVKGHLYFASGAERAEVLRRDATATFGTFRDLKAEAVAKAGGLSDGREVEKQLELLSKQALQQDVR